jgi:hypothetical protein
VPAISAKRVPKWAVSHYYPHLKRSSLPVSRLFPSCGTKLFYTQVSACMPLGNFTVKKSKLLKSLPVSY